MYAEFLGIPRERAGLSEVEVEATTLGQLLGVLSERFPAFGDLLTEDGLHPVDGRQSQWGALRRRLDDGAEGRRPRPDSVRRRRRLTDVRVPRLLPAHRRQRRGCHGGPRAPRRGRPAAALGGSGLGARLLLDTGGANGRSPVAGCPDLRVQSPRRHARSRRRRSSPWSARVRRPHRFNDSLASSGFAVAGAGAGADAIVIVGRAAVGRW